jgi:DtxR family Mn-dependent transcriptional regulator
MNPYSILLWISLAVLALSVVFAPKYGLLARFRAYRVSWQREQVEDALKYLLTQERAGRYASTDALAGALHLSRSDVLALSTRLASQSLVQMKNGGLALTAEGERWALQVVRAHRLWERYLADEARLPLEKVHQEAHRREHRLSRQQVDDLDVLLGYPESDPHGDPIPDRLGHITPSNETPLTGWAVGNSGRIVHLEDEPPLAYAQILAEGLRLGMVVRVLEVDPERILLSDGQSEYRLAPAVAANVSLVPLPESPIAQPGVVPLAELPDGVSAEIVALDEACQGFTRRRLLDLGMTPGTELHSDMRTFFGDPRAYRVRGTLIALRREQAEQIWVRPVQASSR